MPELDNFQKFMSSLMTGKPTFMLLTAKNCAPCEKAKPIYETIKDVFAEQAEFYQSNVVDLPPEFVSTRRIRTAPTLLMFRFGVEENRLFGEEQLAQMGVEIGKFIDDYASEQAGSTTAEFECEACQ